MTDARKLSWPGNVRELENVIQRAIILARGNTLRAGKPARESARRGAHEHRRGMRARGLVRTPASGLQDPAGRQRRSREQRQQDAGGAQPEHLASLSASADPAGRSRITLRRGRNGDRNYIKSEADLFAIDVQGTARVKRLTSWASHGRRGVSPPMDGRPCFWHNGNRGR